VGYDLATAYDDQLVALYVMSNEQFDKQRQSREGLPGDTQRYSVEMASGGAAEMAGDAVDMTLDTYDSERVATRGVVGDPANTIPDIADELDPRYVVVGGRKRSLARQALFGSVSQAVIRNVEQPVVTLMDAE